MCHLQSRVDALKRLLQISSTLDVQQCEAWTQIKQGLQDALAESDPQLWVSTAAKGMFCFVLVSELQTFSSLYGSRLSSQ